jgi:hypothetical protein
MDITLERLKINIANFSDKTFGIDRPYTAPLYHLKKEIDETIEDGDIEEYADMLLLLLDSFRKKHPTKNTLDLLQVSQNKIVICESREWGKPDENGVIEHIRK